MDKKKLVLLEDDGKRPVRFDPTRTPAAKAKTKAWGDARNAKYGR